MLPTVHAIKNGRVLMFEGIDGVGKTTQLELVQHDLETAGWPVLSTRNLGGTPIGEALRKIIKSPLERPALTDFYISLAIQEPLLELIAAARKQGKIILMDRGPLSLAAYQIYGSGVDEKLGWQHVKRAMEAIKPEAIILYETSLNEASKRSRQHPGKADYFESKPPEYFIKVADGYRQALKEFPNSTTIDATYSIDQIQQQTAAVISAALRA